MNQRVDSLFYSFSMAVAILLGSAVYGQEGEAEDKPAPEPSTAAAQAPEDENEIKIPPPVPAKKRVFTAQEVREQCNRFEGRFVSFYGEIYKIEKCKRRPVHANETVFQLQRNGIQIVEVKPVTIAALPEGDSLDLGAAESRPRPCSTFHNHYITHSMADVFWVVKCTKQLIPDYETYVMHRKTTGKNAPQEVLSVSWTEFSALKNGADVPSVIPKEFAKVLDMAPPVDVIPIDEACAGLNGKIVSFYSRLYRIEKCRKREMDPEALGKKAPELAVQELKPEQWISLPDGAPIIEKSSEAKPEPFDPGRPQ